jgi:hypothetical protein
MNPHPALRFAIKKWIEANPKDRSYPTETMMGIVIVSNIRAFLLTDQHKRTDDLAITSGKCYQLKK